MRACSRPLLPALLLCVLVACTEDLPTAAPDVEVVATVGDRNITSAELEHVLRQRSLETDSAPVAVERRRAVLADLVRMEAMAQLATVRGWDEDPALAIEARIAARRALAAETERRTLRALPPPTAEQIRRFIDDNPHAFGARQWLTFEELSLPLPDAELMSALDRALRAGASFEALARRLHDAQLTPTRRVSGAGTEQLPRALVKALVDAGPDKPQILRGMPDRLTVMVLRAATPAPIVDAEAERVAFGLVQDLQRRHAAQQQIQQAVDAVSIEYHGEFADDFIDKLDDERAEAAARAADAPGASAASQGETTASDTGTANRTAQGTTPLPLPAGRATADRPAVGDTLRVAAGLAVGAAFVLLTLLMALRHELGKLWLPRVGSSRAPEAPLLPLSVLYETARQTGLHAYNPSFWSGAGRPLLWLAWLTGLVSLSLLVSRQWAGLGLGVTAASLAIGLVLGVLAAYAFARSPWRTSTRRRTWLPVLLPALAWLGLSAGLLWMAPR